MRRQDEDNFAQEAFNNRKQKGKKRGNKKGKQGGQMTLDAFYEGQERRKVTSFDMDTEMVSHEEEETKGAAAASVNDGSCWAGFQMPSQNLNAQL